ncbi:MAG: response regulator [Chloroflexi bacterium]|jgi:CheY-like chemotaxis protein|nr:response regulator [Chloroflexota bacterium]MBT7080412.1 response regulator [Chloroflexota bacterium]MBT7289243.1 response regulator [Chloroflexota bacterium]
MASEVAILIVEDDEGHAMLIEKNLRRALIRNEIVRFRDGQEVLDFLFRKGDGPHRVLGEKYLMLLDIRMPKVDGVEVLRQIKQDEELSSMPIIMVTTTDDPREVDQCHALGCNNYVTKPVEYEKFVKTIEKLGLFIMVVEVPRLNGDVSHGKKIA